MRKPRALVPLLALVLSLTGCPHLIYAVPTLRNEEPRLSGAAPGDSGEEFAQVTLDLETEGHFLVYHLRVDGRSLEPSAGPCRRWFMLRNARVAEETPRRFCDEDLVRFHVAPGVAHTVELVVGSEHTVAKRVYVEPGDHLRWRMPIATQRVDLSIDPEPGHWYRIEGREVALDLRRALGADAPRGTRWDPKEHSPSYSAGLEVGSMKFRVVDDDEGRVVQELWVPLYSGPMTCEAPFC